MPTPMMEEVDRIVERFPEFRWNRQQFVETAVREKIERYKLLEAGFPFGSERRSPRSSQGQ